MAFGLIYMLDLFQFKVSALESFAAPKLVPEPVFTLSVLDILRSELIS